MRRRQSRLSTRRRRERARRLRARAALALCVAALGAMAASPGAREGIAGALSLGARSAQAVFAGSAQERREVTLGAMRVCALQLGVYDNGERAQAEQERLTAAGLPCVVWQGERMRIVCAAAPDEGGLSGDVGAEVYTIWDDWDAVSLRLSGTQDDTRQAEALLTLPDALFLALARPEKEQPLEDAIRRARETAQARRPSGGENALCAQLAQSLANWASLIEQTRQELGDAIARRYAQVTMATLCRELRAVLIAQASERSTASAQRTPSTAADVIPPA